MSFKAVWPFLEESALLLQTDLGWEFSTTNPGWWAPVSSDAYTYASYPGTHWSMAGLQGQWMQPPPALQPIGQVGCWTFAMKQMNPGASLVVNHEEGAYYNRVYLSTNNVFSLYVRTTFKESASINVDPTRWHYYCFKSDMFSNPYKAEFWMDGVQLLSGTQAEATPRTASYIRFYGSGTHAGAVPSTGTYFAGISYWDSYSDTAETPAYFSAGDPTEDVSESDISGTDAWVATNGDTTRYTEVAGTFDEATYVRKTTPANGDNVILGIAGAGTDDIGDQLGFNSGGTILGISLHMWGTGEAVYAHAAIGDGSNITAGTSTLVSAADPTHLHIGTAVSPTGPAWALTDQPQLIFEVD